MNTKDIEHMAELALLRAIPDRILHQAKPGRLTGLCAKLTKAVDLELRRKHKMAAYDIARVGNRLTAFGKTTGWEGKERHVTTVLSFLLAMIEESQFRYPQKITDILNEIFEYFDRTGGAKKICFVAGDIASRKWEAMKT